MTVPGGPRRRRGRVGAKDGSAFSARGSGGFTMLEVMVAMILGTIGLLGTVAVQQAMFGASANAQDAAVATRLVSRTMEELDARILTSGPPVVDQMAAAVTAGWSVTGYCNSQGAVNPAATADFRFKREVRIINLGAAQPYNVSVQITYALDTGTPRVMRLDRQRWKTW